MVSLHSHDRIVHHDSNLFSHIIRSVPTNIPQSGSKEHSWIMLGSKSYEDAIWAQVAKINFLPGTVDGVDQEQLITCLLTYAARFSPLRFFGKFEYTFASRWLLLG